MLISHFHKILLAAVVVVLFSCRADEDYPGTEYAPNMYHSVPYEPLKQIVDENAGQWLSNRADEKGEFYNSNPNNPHNMTMRLPAPNTVPRTKDGMLPYRVPKDSMDLAARAISNPLDSTEAIVAEGKALYGIYCDHCHGTQGQGDGLVGQVIKGVPPYDVGRVAELTEGKIFHTITYGYGRMNAHASQISIEDRWKITEYVQLLQNRN
jgi:cytochrome c5